MRTRWISAVFAAVSSIAWAQPVVPAGGAGNAADYSKRVAPGAYVIVFGENLAPDYLPAGMVPLPTSLGGTSIELKVGETISPLPLWYVMPNQVVGQLPYGITENAQVRVRTAEGASSWDGLSVVPRAPAYFSINEGGFGRAVALDENGDLITRQNPLKPGHWFSLWVNSLGELDPPKPAGSGGGDGQPGNPYNLVTDPVVITVDARTSQVGYAGLAPYIPGLYQLNVFSPYMDLAGDLVTTMSVGGADSLEPMSLPVEPNGFYFVMSAGKFPNGQTRNGVPGPNSAVKFLHLVPEIWGERGYGQWTGNIEHLVPAFAETSGLALTLRNNGAIVYDNNGIEDGTHTRYYDNSDQAVADADKAGLWEWYSMSNNLDASFAGYFRLTQATTFDQLIGYFDEDGQAKLPFDPANVYNRFRMNIWSNGPNGPANSSFTGDVFSSDTTPGVFEYSSTGVRRIFSDQSSDEILRMVYTLETPITLPAGEYWFGHDTAVPEGMSSPVVLGAGHRAASSGTRPVPNGGAVSQDRQD